jgi:GxxExxY protein
MERDAQSHAIIGACMAVHQELGRGFLEPVYQAALAIELRHAAIPFTKEAPLPVYYRGTRLDISYRVDFICFDSLLVEIKALPQLSGIEESQVLNYLKASRLKKALLINFGAWSLGFKRLVLEKKEFYPQIDAD